MSFPRAPIHRFNEDMSCAPPPNRYDPKLESKVKGAAMVGSKRFPDQIYTSSSLDSLNKPAPSNLTFRTPQVKRKVLPGTPRTKYVHGKKLDTPISAASTTTANSEDRLQKNAQDTDDISRANDQRLEKELSSQVDKQLCLLERDSKISKLQEALEQCRIRENELKRTIEEKSVVASEKVKQLLELKNNIIQFDQKFKEERDSYQNYIKKLNEQILLISSKKSDLEGVIDEKQNALITINDKYLVLENELKSLREENQKKFELMQVSHSEVLNKVVLESECKIQQLEENLEVKVRIAEKELNEAQQKVQVDFQTKLNFVCHEFDLKRQEMESNMKECVLRIKSLEAMVDNKVKDILKSVEEADERCKYMYRELQKVEDQRDDLVKSDLENKLAMINLQSQSNTLENNLEICRDKCKKYEITLNTMNNTIVALSDRLLTSEKEVERLSQVEVDLDAQKKQLEEKTQLLLTDITALRSGMDKMEKDIISEVTALKNHLAAKVDHLKAEAAKQISNLNAKIHEQQHTINLLLGENDFYKKECNRKEDHVRDLQLKVKNYKEEVVNIKKDCSKIQNEFSEKLSAQKNLYSILNNKLDNAITCIGELEKLKLNHESQINNLIKDIEKYKMDIADSIQSNEQLITQKNELEDKQQQYIDELIADIVLEKERCLTLETEKDEIKNLLQVIEDSNYEKCRIIKDLESKLESTEKSLRNAEEKCFVTNEAKSTLEMQLIQSENDVTELNKTKSKLKKELENRICELESSLHSAKETIENEIPNLQHDNINKAEYILELSMSIDSLKDEIVKSSNKISCMEAEKASLNLYLDEANNKISTLENMLDEKNICINNLTNKVNWTEARYKSSVAQGEMTHSNWVRLNQELQVQIDNFIVAEEKRLNAEKLVDELKKQLTTQVNSCREKGVVEVENEQLKDELEGLRQRLNMVTDERDKLDKEVAELVGHHNIRQKIKHVNQLKIDMMKERERADNLEIENTLLRKKLAEFKENSNSALQENTPKISKHSAKKVLSPAILKDRNQ